MLSRSNTRQPNRYIFSYAFFFPQLENIGNFVRAITEYGLKPHDIFEANDLFENVNHTQVQSTLIALTGMVRAATHTHTHNQVQSPKTGVMVNDLKLTESISIVDDIYICIL